MIVYLAGPINSCTDSECRDWREAAKKDHPEYEYLDPMRNDYRGQENEPGIDVKIVKQDKQDIMDSDVLLVNYDKPSVGTSMEVLFAWESGLEIIVVAKEGTIISPWLKYHADTIVPTFARAFKYIEELSKEEKRETDPFTRLGALFDEMENSWQRIFGKSHKFDS